MSSSYGKNVKITIFGQSHSAGIGVTMEGLPYGFNVDMEKLQSFLTRRAPGRNAYSTARKEADLPEFLSGLKDGHTCGAPLTAIIRNTDTRSGDYSPFTETPRPGHADFTASIKYNGSQDPAGGGHFSGRLTAPLCIAGGICLQILESRGITVMARIASIGKVFDPSPLTTPVGDKLFPVVDDSCGEKMQEAIAEAKQSLDSIGGTIECIVNGLPVGLGDPMFDGMENRISSIVFGIPAVKGIEFGAGFAVSEMFGSQNNDNFIEKDGKIITETNNCGGILGGITNGMPLNFKVALKPTPSIGQVQKTINMNTLEEADLVIKGRHDPCIVPRAVPVVEAAAAIAVYDALLDYDKYRR